jgi:hypothetical protein
MTNTAQATVDLLLSSSNQTESPISELSISTSGVSRYLIGGDEEISERSSKPNPAGQPEILAHKQQAEEEKRTDSSKGEQDGNKIITPPRLQEPISDDVMEIFLNYKSMAEIPLEPYLEIDSYLRLTHDHLDVLTSIFDLEDGGCIYRDTLAKRIIAALDIKNPKLLNSHA